MKKYFIVIAGVILLFGIQAVSADNNFVLNGSFEISSNPGMPDGWGNGQFGIKYADEIQAVDQVRERFRLDSTEKVQGANSFRLSNPSTGRQQALYSCWINLPVFIVARDGWCLSAFIKTTPPSKVKLELLNSASIPIDGCEFDATGEFQRFFTNINIKTKSSPVIVRVSGSPGATCWIDGVQLERGSSPSEWASAANDKKLDIATVASRKLISMVEGTEVFQKSGFDPVQKVELRNKFIYVNGKPFYPYCADLGWTADAESFRTLKAAGFNSIVFTAPNRKSTQAALDAAFKVGLRVVPWLRCANEQAFEIVNSLKNHPALLFWYVIDEPPDPFAQVVVERVRRLRELDPDHPMFANYYAYTIITNLKNLVDLSGDIISADLYPVANLDYPGTVLAPADLISKMDQALAANAKTSMFCLQLTGNYASWSRELTPEEFEGMTYLSCIAGARGLIFFQNIPWNKRLFESAAQIGLELDSLAPVLASQEMSPKMKCSSDAIRLTCRTYQGHSYLICVNASKEPIKADFSTQVPFQGDVKVLFENRTIKTLPKNMFSDDFAGYQRRVYKVAFSSEPKSTTITPKY